MVVVTLVNELFRCAVSCEVVDVGAWPQMVDGRRRVRPGLAAESGRSVLTQPLRAFAGSFNSRQPSRHPPGPPARHDSERIEPANRYTRLRAGLSGNGRCLRCEQLRRVRLVICTLAGKSGRRGRGRRSTWDEPGTRALGSGRPAGAQQPGGSHSLTDPHSPLIPLASTPHSPTLTFREPPDSSLSIPTAARPNTVDGLRS